jgi:hypothetical protein
MKGYELGRISSTHVMMRNNTKLQPEFLKGRAHLAKLDILSFEGSLILILI